MTPLGAKNPPFRGIRRVPNRPLTFPLDPDPSMIEYAYPGDRAPSCQGEPHHPRVEVLMRAFNLLYLAVATLVLTSAALAQQTNPDPSHPPKSRISNSLSALGREYIRARDNNLRFQTPPQFAPLVVDDAGRVRVRVTARDVAALKPALVAMGFIPAGERPALHFIEGFVPLDRIDTLEPLAANGLMGVVPSLRPILQAGIVNSQADNVLYTDRVRTARPTGYDGTGIKIGVLSDSYDSMGGAAAGVASGDLPPDVQLVQPDILLRGTDEGRAMLELIHDLAPGAKLAFATAFGDESSFADNIIALQQAGCKVICDDVRYLEEPYFQDGVISQAVRTVSTRGVAYFSSAGNQASRSFESVGWRETGIQSPVGPYFIQWFDFDDGPGADARQLVQLTRGQSISIMLQWDDPFYTTNGVVNDLDIYVVEAGGNEILTKSYGDDDNILNQTPTEFVYYENDSTPFQFVEIMIHRTQGFGPARLKYINFGSNIFIQEFDTRSPTVTAHGSGDGGLAVAAAPYFNHTTPESFTSTGPRTVLFTPSGARLPFEDVRDAPQICAIDGTDTTFFYQSDFEGNGHPNFFGTSAAAPHAAAVAALIRQAIPDYSPQDVYNLLQTTADPAIGGPGFDVQTGAGLINAWNAIFGAPVPATIPFTDGFESGILSPAWELRSTVNGRIQVTAANSPAGGLKHVTMDTFFRAGSPNTFSLNELILHVFADGYDDIQLVYTHRRFADFDHEMSAFFSGSQNSDGIAISVDGINWYRVISLTGANSTAVNQTRVLNLSQLASDVGIVPGRDFRIKFQQYEDAPIPLAGFTFDNIAVIGSRITPAIVVPPSDRTVCLGAPAAFTVAAAGNPPLSYRWQKNGVDLTTDAHVTGTNTPTLSIAASILADAGAYGVIVTNSTGGQVTSPAATLTINSPPSIASSELNVVTCPSQHASIQPNISGSAPISYQWFKDGQPINGATGPSLTFDSARYLDAGLYTLRATNPCGEITTAPIELQVFAPEFCDPTLGFQGCPDDQTVTASTPDGEVVYFYPPQVIPPSDRVVLSATHAPASLFPIGLTIVTFSARDTLTNVQKSCNFTVTVVQPPGDPLTGQPGYPAPASNPSTPAPAGQPLPPDVVSPGCATMGFFEMLACALVPFTLRRRACHRRPGLRQ